MSLTKDEIRLSIKTCDEAIRIATKRRLQNFWELPRTCKPHLTLTDLAHKDSRDFDERDEDIYWEYNRALGEIAGMADADGDLDYEWCCPQLMKEKLQKLLRAT